MTLKINFKNTRIEAEIKNGESILDAINKSGIDEFDAPCGGQGTCGKCKILVLSNAAQPDEVEKKALSKKELSAGIRLACRIYPEADMEISISTAGKKAAIQSSFDGTAKSDVLADRSTYHRHYVELPKPSIEDQRTDLNRLRDGLAMNGSGSDSIVPIHLLKSLSTVIREKDFHITASTFNDRLIQIESGDISGEYYAVAIDIGTTTIVAYLVTLSTDNRGQIVDHVSGLNSQKGYGADVVSRIEYCMKKDGNLEELHSRIIRQINSMVRELVGCNKIEIESIGLLTIAGNTTMTHIFAGLDPRGIAVSPFISVDTSLELAMAGDFGLDLHSGCCCAVLPGIASYVGADITAGIVATGMHESEELCLLIDVGTNGEIVLGNKDGMIACSAAAGPAMEGANISCGMGGVSGAINSITASREGEQEVFTFDVIDDVEPLGLCGSGITDAVAIFVKAGLIDNTGRIPDEEELIEAGVHNSWIDCIDNDDSGKCIKITENISLTQKDIREIQMAKAAISAGVKVLLAEADFGVTEVKKLFIAGGFGSAINKSSAAAIGIFPPELEDVVEVAGNTAGKGAIMAALSKTVMADMVKISNTVKYIELSTSALFQQEYMLAMYF